MTEPCVFCEIVAGNESATVIAEDPGALAFEPLNPATKGHTLVIPKPHARDLWDLPAYRVGHLFEFVREVGADLRAIHQPEGVNVIHSAGAAATQTVFHLHVHLVPRWAGDRMGPIWPEAGAA